MLQNRKQKIHILLIRKQPFDYKSVISHFYGFIYKVKSLNIGKTFVASIFI
jgi:hypothetical protein